MTVEVCWSDRLSLETILLLRATLLQRPSVCYLVHFDVVSILLIGRGRCVSITLIAFEQVFVGYGRHEVVGVERVRLVAILVCLSAVARRHFPLLSILR